MNDLPFAMLANGMARGFTIMFTLLGLGGALAILSVILLAIEKTRWLSLFPGAALLGIAVFLAAWSRFHLIVPAAAMACVAIPVIVLALGSSWPR
jgi:hypothetical protein